MSIGKATYKINADTRQAQSQIDGLVKGALPGFEKMSGAINSTSTLIGGLGGKAGQAFGAFKQLGEAFLIGGPVGAGIAVGIALVGKVVDEFNRAEKAAARAQEAAKKLGDELNKALKDSDARAASTEKRLRDFGVASTVVEIQDTSSALFEARQATEKLNKESADTANTWLELRKSVRDFGQARNENEANELRALKAKLSATEDLMPLKAAEEEKSRAEAEALERSLAALEGILAAEEKRSAKDDAKKPKGRGSGAAVKEDTLDADVQRRIRMSMQITANERRFIEERDQYERDVNAAQRQYELDEDERIRALKLSREKNLAEEIAKNEKAWLDDKHAYEIELSHAMQDANAANNQMFIDAAMSMWADYEALAQGAIMSAFSVYIGAVEQMAAGQQVQFDELAAGFVKQIGMQLVGIGIKQTFEGAGFLAQGIATSNPGAIAAGSSLIGIGVAATAAGTAMATTGAVWQGSISGRDSGGGGGSSSGRGSVARQSSRGDGGTTENQGITLVYNGGTFFGDPSEGARRQDRNRRRSGRNVFIPAEV